jgi:transcriptional regulator of NAD metabolism
MVPKTYITLLTFDTKSKKGIKVRNFPLPEKVENYLIENTTIEESDRKIARELIRQGITDEEPFNIFVDDLYGVKED